MTEGDRIARGNTADIYLQAGRIVKVFDKRFPQGEAAYEADKQRFALSRGLPVPEIFQVTEVEGKQAISMEYVAGPTLGELMRRDRTRTAKYLACSIRMQRQVHQVWAEPLKPMEEKLRRQILSAPGLEEALREKALRRLDALPHGRRLCHGDFHAFNLVQGTERVVILDWVDASAGHPHADVCRSYLLYVQAEPAIADVYLRQYCAESGAPAEAILRWEPVIAAARLAEGLPGKQQARLLEKVRGLLA